MSLHLDEKGKSHARFPLPGQANKEIYTVKKSRIRPGLSSLPSTAWFSICPLCDAPTTLCPSRPRNGSAPRSNSAECIWRCGALLLCCILVPSHPSLFTSAKSTIRSHEPPSTPLSRQYRLGIAFMVSRPMATGTWCKRYVVAIHEIEHHRMGRPPGGV
ncbi:hypothetical protein B0H11DRAFT_183838 [Mycena galericulata]|nr:hypothetical protein B0H11DRAFT_183838 [Mycena galericulata]